MSERVRAVLQALDKNPPRHHLQILKTFLALVEREVANHTAEVEYAGSLTPSAVEAIRTQLTSAYGRKIAVRTRQNDSLIAGVRVRVGCDVYESSIAGALSQLQTSLS